MILDRLRTEPRFRIACTLSALVAATAMACAGCTRNHYRQQADQAAARLWRQFTAETGQPPVPPTVYVRPESRMFDPLDPDHPAMPPDDPVSHTRMHWIDGMRAYRRWHKYGDTPFVDYGQWRAYLPYDEQGRVVLDLPGAVQLGYVHSRNYQRQLENLYLSALDVTLERFRFDSQFFGGNGTFFTTDGARRPGSGGVDRSILTTDSNASLNKMYAGGGQLIVELANNIVWQFAGADTNANATLLDFSLVQPLLRFGGRARVLERLTVAERSLLANVRLFEQYRQAFYAQIAAGRNPGDGPVRRTGTAANTGLASGLAGTTPALTAGGYIGLLQSLQEIRNQAGNVTTLRDSLARLQSEFDAGRINDKFQVELARQALFQGQSRLISLRAAYQTQLDAFKVLLGLPPDLEIELDDPLLDPFQLIDPRVSQLTERAGRIALRAHKPGYVLGPADLDEFLNPQTGVRAEVRQHLQSVEEDYRQLLANVARRERQLVDLASRVESGSEYTEASAYSPQEFRERVDSLGRDLKDLQAGLEDTWKALEALRADLPTLTPAQSKKRLEDIHPVLSSQMLALTLARARARVDTATCQTVSLTPEQALEAARLNRRDWMNARAQLVDAWRLIEFNANALKSGLSVTLNGDITTLNDNPINFRGSTGRLRAGLEFDAPLTRLIERNVYRQSLIEYQQARRSYMQFEDQVYQSLRLVLRTIELNQLNFEIRRSAVLVAIKQVDLAREKLSRPLKPGEDATKYGLERASIGRDLVNALDDMLSTQNDFLNVWVTYQVQRINLDLEMGTMQLDERGLWIDPGPITAEPETEPTETLPPEIAVPEASGGAAGESIQPPKDGGVGELPAPPVLRGPSP